MEGLMSGGADMCRAEVIGMLWLYEFSRFIFSISKYVIGGRAPLGSVQHEVFSPGARS